MKNAKTIKKIEGAEDNPFTEDSATMEKLMPLLSKKEPLTKEEQQFLKALEDKLGFEIGLYSDLEGDEEYDEEGRLI